MLNDSALANEINTDPAGLGYAAGLAAKNDQGLADILNLPRAGAGFAANLEPVTSAQLFSRIDATELFALPAIKLQQLQCVLAAGAIDLNDPATQAVVLGIFPVAGVTRANVQAALKRQGSRAEALFGRGVSVTSSDVSRALRGL
jgi:hypothetical protein